MKAQRGMYIMGIIIFSLMLVGVALFSAQASNQPDLEPPPLSDAKSLIPETSDWTVVRLYFNDRNQLNHVAGQLDIWEVNNKENYAVVALPPEQHHWLDVLGYRMQIDAEKTALFNKPLEMLPGQITGIPGYPCYRTVDETYADMANLAMLNPALASWIDIGDSWDKITPGEPTGYDINSLVLTNKNIPGPKPTFFLMAEIHAREYTTAELAARFAEYLVANYGIDPDVTWLLDYFEVHIVPMTNPDGRKLAEAGILWRKNTDSDDLCIDRSRWGTDLNRNHSFKWDMGGSSDYSCDQTYHGPGAASEPETQAIQNYITNLFPDQRGPDDNDPAPDDTMGVFITLHSYSELVLWPWGWTPMDSPNHPQLRTLGRKFAYFNSYTAQQSHDLYPTSGTSDEWAYGELGIAAYTFELGTSFFQSCTTFEKTILPDNVPALLAALKATRRPYMNPLGPDSLNVTVNPVSVIRGDPVNLTAAVDDTRFSSGEPTQDVQAARYSINDPSWITGTLTYPMSALDGSFDETVEDVIATIDTGGLSAGKHTIFVEGQDADGNWGAPSAVFLYIIEPGISPVIEGYVRDINFNFPLDAIITAGPFQASNDPYSGYYNMYVISSTYDISAVVPGYVISTTTGVHLQNYQTLQKDFYLEPLCEFFFDDIEAGNIGWTAQGSWAITDEASHNPSHSWTDSPGGDYENNLNYSLTSPLLNLSGNENTVLSFWHMYDLDKNNDYAYLEYSTNAGATWSGIDTYTGEGQMNWVKETYAVPELNNESDVRIRFRIKTDNSVTYDGWHIDDVLIAGSSAVCDPYSPPTSDFTSNSPVELGNVMYFTNLTTGTQPMTYTWSFGDGNGFSNQSDPRYTYQKIGDFTVTLTTTNFFGADTNTRTVSVVEPVYDIFMPMVSKAVD